ANPSPGALDAPRGRRIRAPVPASCNGARTPGPEAPAWSRTQEQEPHMTATIEPIRAPGSGPAPTAHLAAHAVDAVKVYGRGEAEVRALDGVSVGFESGH